ncbi:NAD-dependent epimerase/dehydratase family protein [Myxococcota bacterium]|nr:NAD-dependent epimerase/dehydratase family protein [Myxococcota bacterium]
MRLLVTGGAGFIGAVAARRGLLRGDEVWVLDDLSRAGSEERLAGLLRDGLESRRFLRVDLSDRGAAEAALEGVPEPEAVLHLASQVAVTTSVEDPLRDFQVNAAGTVHLLEWVRRRAPGAAVVYASTNKVYGELADLVVERRGDRLAFRDLPRGVAEDRPVDFHSPYGCSKGAADLYCVDYARIFGLRTAVLRQSCIYGPEQSGEERQGWVSCFARAVRDRAPSTETATRPATCSTSRTCATCTTWWSEGGSGWRGTCTTSGAARRRPAPCGRCWGSSEGSRASPSPCGTAPSGPATSRSSSRTWGRPRGSWDGGPGSSPRRGWRGCGRRWPGGGEGRGITSPCGPRSVAGTPA